AELAEGEAMDLAHGASFYPTATVRTAVVEEMVDADAVVVAAGRGGIPGQSRLDLLRENVGIISDIGGRLAGCRGTIIMVTNPVDVLTRVMRAASCARSGPPPRSTLHTCLRYRGTWRFRSRSMVGSIGWRHSAEGLATMEPASRNQLGRAGADGGVRDYSTQGCHQPCDWPCHSGLGTVHAARRTPGANRLPRSGGSLRASRRCSLAASSRQYGWRCKGT